MFIAANICAEGFGRLNLQIPRIFVEIDIVTSKMQLFCSAQFGEIRQILNLCAVEGRTIVICIAEFYVTQPSQCRSLDVYDIYHLSTM